MSRDEERIIFQSTSIISKEGEKPGFLGMGLRTGTLLLTNKRLVYLKSRLGLTNYETTEAFEKDLKKKGSLEIPLSAIKEMRSDRHRLTPYFNVQYETDSGNKIHCLWSEDGVDMSVWVEKIYEELESTRGAEKLPSAKRRRSMVLVDQSHDQERYGKERIADVVYNICTELGLEEPTALQGKPSHELIAENRHLLQDTALLASFATKSSEKFSPTERELIEEYVSGGGRLLLSSDPPYKPPHEITETFGIGFGEKVIEDESNHEGKHKDHILVKKFTDHPINEGVNVIRFADYGCHPIELLKPDAIALAFSSVESVPPEKPVAALSSHGEGLVMVIGQTTLFQDKYLDDHDNEKWFRNIIGYLLSEKQPIAEETEPIGETDIPTEITVKFCPNCGCEIVLGDKFCGKCGQKII